MKDVPKALSLSRSMRAARYASAGIRYALLNEPAFQRIVFIEVVLAIGIGWYLYPLTKVDIGLLVLAAVLPLITELLNTSIEILANMVQPKKDDNVKHIKDCAAGATLLAACASLIICVAMVLLR